MFGVFPPRRQPSTALRARKTVQEVYSACCQSGHELLLEVILPADMERNDELYLRAIKRFYNLGIKTRLVEITTTTSAKLGCS